MQLATYITDEKQKSGIFYSNHYYSFQALLGKPLTMIDFIKEYENSPLPDFVAAVKTIEPDLNAKICPPIPNPARNIICLGKNYLDHVKEVAETIATGSGHIPDKPVYFAKNASPSMGHKDTIPLHQSFTKMVDYEAELAVIIGKTAKSIAPKDVEKVIFGYTILNDITARDIQTQYGQWYLGKSLDGFCSIGPYIITKDEIPFPVALNIQCRVNGETRQSSNTSMLIYGISRVISELSHAMTLYPGDIIATGTPGGIGHAMNPPAYLKKGDLVECEIEGIGILENIFE